MELLEDAISQPKLWSVREYNALVIKRGMALDKKIAMFNTEKNKPFRDHCKLVRATWSKKVNKKTSYVYLMSSEKEGVYKIGFSKQPLKRHRSLVYKYKDKLCIECLIPTSDPKKLESQLHEQFHHKRLVDEFFALSDDEVKSIVELAQS